MKIRYHEKELEVEKGKTIYEILKDEIENSKYTVVGAIYNNEYTILNRKITEDGEIELLNTSTKEGMRTYRRTLVYIFAMALRKILPDCVATVDYQMANAIYCDLGKTDVTDEIIKKLNEQMEDIVKRDLPITEKVMNREEAEEFFEKNNTKRGYLQFELKSNKKIYMYFCEDYFNYCYGIIANRTGAIKAFKVIKYDKGLLIRYPSVENPNQVPILMQNKKLKWAFDEYNEIHVMLNYAKEAGVPEEDIFCDHAGFSTYDSMYRASSIFQAEKIIVVTQKYQQYRALYIGEKLDLEVLGVASDQQAYRGGVYREMREILARAKDFLKVMTGGKATLGGEVIPISGEGLISHGE